MVSIVSASVVFRSIRLYRPRGPSNHTTENPGAIKATARCFVLALAVCTAGCATVTLDPYDRPYLEANMMTPGPLNGCCAEDGVDTPPQLVFGTRPLYPINQRRFGKEGQARIWFSVSEVGKVSVIKYESSEDRYFADHAAIATRDWRVLPATRNGVPVAVTCGISFNYEIEK